MTGREAENYVAEYLSKQDFFVGDFNKSNSGQQPFDQIAINNNKVLAYDVKHCKRDYFPFTRVEDNQIRALSYLDDLNNPVIETYIMLVYKEEITTLPFKEFLSLEGKDTKSVKPSSLKPLKEVLQC